MKLYLFKHILSIDSLLLHAPLYRESRYLQQTEKVSFKGILVTAFPSHYQHELDLQRILTNARKFRQPKLVKYVGNKDAE